MKLNELMNELQYGESIEVECKKASNSLPKSVWETYSSFANTNGGTIYLGVEEQKDKNNIWNSIDIFIFIDRV